LLVRHPGHGLPWIVLSVGLGGASSLLIWIGPKAAAMSAHLLTELGFLSLVGRATAENGSSRAQRAPGRVPAPPPRAAARHPNGSPVGGVPAQPNAGAPAARVRAACRSPQANDHRTKRRFVLGNLAAALSEEPRPGADRKLSGKEEALLIATACSSPLEGRAR